MVWSFVYLAVRSLFALVLLFGRSDRSKELELLVLRHQLAVLRRRSGRPRIERSDRALLSTLSRALPRRRWATFSVSPETVLRWHRQPVTRPWTYPRVKLGRPPLERPRRELILRLARENPHWGLKGANIRVARPSPPRPERRRLRCGTRECRARRSARAWLPESRGRPARPAACPSDALLHHSASASSF